MVSHRNDAPWRGTGSWFRAQGGFTLIELITVIIILGILAAVVGPKYFNLTDQTEENVNKQALSEAIVHFNLAYMEYVVDNRTPPGALSNMSGSEYLGLDGNGKVQVGDYRFTYTQPSSDVTVSAEVLENGSWTALTDRNGAAMTRTIPWP